VHRLPRLDPFSKLARALLERVAMGDLLQRWSGRLPEKLRRTVASNASSLQEESVGETLFMSPIRSMRSEANGVASGQSAFVGTTHTSVLTDRPPNSVNVPAADAAASRSRARIAEASLRAAEAEVASLRAELERERQAHGLTRQQLQAEREQAQAAAIPPVSPLPKEVTTVAPRESFVARRHMVTAHGVLERARAMEDTLAAVRAELAGLDATGLPSPMKAAAAATAADIPMPLGPHALDSGAEGGQMAADAARAATSIQARVRGRSSRASLHSAAAAEGEEARQAADAARAATSIQARVRGRSSRASLHSAAAAQ
jgi:hypothetical protein